MAYVPATVTKNPDGSTTYRDPVTGLSRTIGGGGQIKEGTGGYTTPSGSVANTPAQLAPYTAQQSAYYGLPSGGNQPSSQPAVQQQVQTQQPGGIWVRNIPGTSPSDWGWSQETGTTYKGKPLSEYGLPYQIYDGRTYVDLNQALRLLGLGSDAFQKQLSSTETDYNTLFKAIQDLAAGYQTRGERVFGLLEPLIKQYTDVLGQTGQARQALLPLAQQVSEQLQTPWFSRPEEQAQINRFLDVQRRQQQGAFQSELEQLSRMGILRGGAPVDLARSLATDQASQAAAFMRDLAIASRQAQDQRAINALSVLAQGYQMPQAMDLQGLGAIQGLIGNLGMGQMGAGVGLQQGLLGQTGNMWTNLMNWAQNIQAQQAQQNQGQRLLELLTELLPLMM